MDSQLRIEYPEFVVKYNLNKLRFSNDPNEYDFSIEDYRDGLQISQSVKSVLHKSSGNKMAVNTSRVDSKFFSK
jgi:hypothetical protein